MDRVRANPIRFGEYEVDPRAGELRRNGTRVRLQEQPFQVLLALLQQPGEVVTREDLRLQVWPKDTFVDFDHALNTAIKKIRCALADDAGVPRYVETIPRRGYRFIGQIEGTDDAKNTTQLLRVETDHQSVRSRRLWVVSAATALAVLIVAAAYITWRSSRAQGSGTSEITLLLMPFANLSGDSDPQYLCEGISEELTIQLARIRPGSLRILDPWVTADRQRRNTSLPDLGRQFHADYMLVGSVRREGNRARVGAQLIRVSDQTHVWGNEFDHEVNDVLSFQRDVAEEIAKEVRPSLVSSQSHPSR